MHSASPHGAAAIRATLLGETETEPAVEVGEEAEENNGEMQTVLPTEEPEGAQVDWRAYGPSQGTQAVDEEDPEEVPEAQEVSADAAASEQGVYMVVEALVAQRWCGRRRQFLVQWEDGTDSWEDEANILDPDLVRDFELYVAELESAVATGPLGALSHDELGVIVDGLADPLEPVVAVALSSTCLGLRTPLQAALEVLKVRHEKAKALCRKLAKSCAELSGAEGLHGTGRLVAADMGTLAMILRTNGLPCLRDLYIGHIGFGDAGMQALCEGLGHGAAPSLRFLALSYNKFGPAGAEALAAALGRGAMPKLEELILEFNPIGNQGISALTAPLRKMPALWVLRLECCEIDDEGMASLFANLGKDDFKALRKLYLDCTEQTNSNSSQILVSVISEGGLPALEEVMFYDDNDLGTSSEVWRKASEKAVRDALEARAGRE